jgi:hypothetical protein
LFQEDVDVQSVVTAPQGGRISLPLSTAGIGYIWRRFEAGLRSSDILLLLNRNLVTALGLREQVLMSIERVFVRSEFNFGILLHAGEPSNWSEQNCPQLLHRP